MCFVTSWDRESRPYFCINLYPTIFIIYIFKFKFLFYNPKACLFIYIINAKCQMLDVKGSFISLNPTRALAFMRLIVPHPSAPVYQVFCSDSKMVMSLIPRVLCQLQSRHICSDMWHPWPPRRAEACTFCHLQQLIHTVSAGFLRPRLLYCRISI